MLWNYWTEQTRFIFISNWFLIHSFLLLIVLQNLTQAITNEQRDSIVNTYVVHDILGCSVAGHVRVRCIEYIFMQACCNLLSLCILCVYVCVPLLFLAQVSCAIYLTINCYCLQLQLLKETTVHNVCITVFSDWVWSLWSWCDSGIRSSKQPNAAVPLGIVNASNYCLFVCMLFFYRMEY